jgi:hypothetical protein
MVDGAGNSAMLAGVQVLDLATLAAAPLAATLFARGAISVTASG